MLLNNMPLVDTAPILEIYNRQGLDITKIEKCNSQEFKYIGGAGEGFFLTTRPFPNETVLFSVDDRTVPLKVLDVLSLIHPNNGRLKLYLYHTAEPKYMLYQDKVQRNFNVTIRKSLPIYGNPTLKTLIPDFTPKTLEEILREILSDTYNLVYLADEVVSYDISIEGLSVGDAIDHLCSIYGFVWTATADTVYIYNMEPGDNVGSGASSENDGMPGFADPYKDINHTVVNPNLSTVNVSFPVYDWARAVPTEYISVQDSSNVAGKIVNVQDPYLQAILDPLGTVRNQGALNSRAALISANLEAIANTIDYIEYNYYNLPSLGTQPQSLSEVVGDLGYGPLTIYRQIKYPYMPLHQKMVTDRLANNWIGALTDGYYGQVSSFTVTPGIALDGMLPPGPQRVYNRYRWNYGEPGWNVRVEWSPFEGIWIALQQEYDCPPEEDPQYEITPPEIPWEEPLGGL